MKHTKRNILIIVSVMLVVLTSFAGTEKFRIRVSVEKANIRLKPSIDSMIIGQAPLGSTFESDQKIREWFSVTMPPDEDGVVLKGFIHESVVEILPSDEEIQKKEEKEKREERTRKPVEPETGIKVPSKVKTEKKPEVPAEKEEPVPSEKQVQEERLYRGRVEREPKFELSLLGGGLFSLGAGSVENLPPDLYTGRWSPWFGQGYIDFIWPDETPETMNTLIGEAVLRQGAGLSAGAKFGWNFHPRFQLDAVFCYYFSGLKFKGGAGDTINSVLADSAEVLLANGREVTTNRSVEISAGKTYLFGLELHFFLRTEGEFLPYVFAGGAVVINSGTPSFSYVMEQSYAGTSASYNLDVTYDKKTAIAPVFGLGVKKYFGSFFGVKAEVSGVLAPLKADQNIETSFSRETASWTPFIDYDAVAAEQKGNRVILHMGLGIFITF